jgi:cysteinyl-tRNA synthetase
MQLFDSLSKTMKPITDEHVSIYACGITPYSSAHVGHARTYVVFHTLANVLRHAGHRVDLARNITDIDDKIIAEAQRQGVRWSDLSSYYAQENRNLMLATNLEIPKEPKASEYIDEIIRIVDVLIEKKHAYVAENGDILYRVASFEGNLLMPHQSGSLRSEQGSGRIMSEHKEDPRDFTLWKRVEHSAPGFETSHGYGRPGWHIECSAMIGKLFGGHVTIHGGGVDLKFPHHQSEIMQSEPVFEKPVADAWMHNGSVVHNGEKMSKSLGNVVLWQDALNEANALVPGLGGDVLRYAMLKTHWQKPLNWTDSLLKEAAKELTAMAHGLMRTTSRMDDSVEPMHVFLNDNFNTPAALGWLRQAATQLSGDRVKEAFRVWEFNIEGWVHRIEHANAMKSIGGLDQDEVRKLQALRFEARQSKNWAEADRIRTYLSEHGVVVQDSALDR